MNNLIPTDNSQNSEFEQTYTMQQKDDLAAELCTEYANYKFYKWYCKVINALGVRRVKEIRAMYSDTRQAKHLFSKRASEEMNAILVKEKLRDMKEKYGSES